MLYNFYVKRRHIMLNKRQWKVREMGAAKQMTVPASVPMQPGKKTLIYDDGFFLVVDDSVVVDELMLLNAIQKKEG
jgi:hypothetical protein